MPGRKGMTHYGMELKLQAVQLHEDEGLTYPQIAQQLGMRTVWQIEIWVRRYRQEGVEGLKRKGSGRPRKTDSDHERLAQLEMENALLKNIIPSCAKLCSRSAISGHRTLRLALRPLSFFVCFYGFSPIGMFQVFSEVIVSRHGPEGDGVISK